MCHLYCECKYDLGNKVPIWVREMVVGHTVEDLSLEDNRWRMNCICWELVVVVVGGGVVLFVVFVIVFRLVVVVVDDVVCLVLLFVSLFCLFFLSFFFFFIIYYIVYIKYMRGGGGYCFVPISLLSFLHSFRVSFVRSFVGRFVVGCKMHKIIDLSRLERERLQQLLYYT